MNQKENRAVQLQAVADFAQSVHEGNGDGHGFDHIKRVIALAQKILATEPEANAQIVLISAYLHDTYDEKLVDDVLMQKNKVADFLTSVSVDKNDAEEIFYIIDNMSYSSNLLEKKSLNLNGKIVQDADRLDAIGAWGIVRTLQYGWKKGRELYNPEIKPMTYQSKADYHQQEKNTTINHFYEKLFLLKALLNTTEAKRIAASRDKIMHDFVSAIENESQENQTRR
ncbi:HD domain-containing protein [Lactococcus fujiensis]|uniref:HD/PDEase domain-containing protein n=1 Tax=Lactococcus fujiensis JCM 16395 TaxID=1291764 RepID=A0A2A5RLT9_9LACT|nr:HD domain-containing protein [Lactococcus fujiensis]PCS00231.1 hypothetical protein RT41_GL001542 [Lactococcus fujiensis JCM 16395]